LPTISIVQKFRGEFEDHLHGRCAYQKNGDRKAVNSSEALIGAR
jgi:hypothetical protein